MKHIIAVILLFNALVLSAQESYKFTINLTVVQEDRVMVSLNTPATREKEVTFYFPKIIPGTYKEADYGRFVNEFKAFDKKGKELPVEQVDENTWKISSANKMTQITYWIDDTYDANMGDQQIYPMAGTNIEAGKSFVLNTPGYFGYFEGQEFLPIELNVIRDESWYGSTGLQLSDSRPMETVVVENTPESQLVVDVYNLEDYHELVDSPLMYNVPDTTIIQVGNAEVLISVYSPTGMVKSEFIAQNVEEILQAQKAFLGGTLPVEKYAFLFYFEEIPKLAPIQGALEHSYSSYYYLPEVPQENLVQTLRDVAAHEFFHIVTPLNIHSEEIEYFDFNDPRMSQHLWMYEGMTEYFANQVQVKYGIIDLGEYMDKIREKMINASEQYNDSLSFTDLSKYTLTDYPDQYGNVYEKGALIGLCLDIMLNKLSDGEYGVQNLMMDLAERYGKSTPFKDEELFDVIEELTYPEIREFIDTYIVAGAVLPYEEILGLVGINYQAKAVYEDYSFGFTQKSIGINVEEQKIYIKDQSALDAFGMALGLKNDDMIMKMNGQDMPGFAEIQLFLENQKQIIESQDSVTYTVLREGKEVDLTSGVVKVEKVSRHLLSPAEEPTPEQLEVRDAWLRPRFVE